MTLSWDYPVPDNVLDVTESSEQVRKIKNKDLPSLSSHFNKERSNTDGQIDKKKDQSLQSSSQGQLAF